MIKKKHSNSALQYKDCLYRGYIMLAKTPGNMKTRIWVKTALRRVTIVKMMILMTGISYGQAQTDTIAEKMLVYQKTYGGWPKAFASKSVNYKVVLTDAQKQAIKATANDDDATIDNKATSREIVYLTIPYAQTKNIAYLDAAKNGIDYLLKAQYANGG